MLLCLATNNTHKVEELQQLLGDSFELKTLKEIGCTDDIEETGTTLEENSRIKAQYIYERYGFPTIADDSGLEVEALGNAPGVYSARFAGEHGNHAKNNEKLLHELADKPNRKARFRAVITLVLEDNEYQFEGIVEGQIAYALSGTDGFGYDPLFIPNGYEQTFAELNLAEKNKISHRGRAVQQLIAFLKDKNKKGMSK